MFLLYKSDKIKDKAKTTCIEKYGVDNPFKNEEIKTKIKSTNQEKYGVDNPSQNKEIQDKRSNTMISKFGIHYYPNGILSAKIKYNVIGEI